MGPHLVFRHTAERKAQEIRLILGGREQEIALVAAGIDRAAQLRRAVRAHPLDIMTGRERIALQVLCGLQQVAEFDRLVAQHTGNRRLAPDIAVGESLDDVFAETGFIVQHVMRNADGLGDPLRIEDILAGAARFFALHRFAVIVELKRHPDDVIALLRQQGSGDGTVHAARHGDDDTRIRGRFGDADGVHGAEYRVFGRPGKRGLRTQDRFRRRVTPRPANSTPKRASVPGSATTAGVFSSRT